MKAVLAFLAVLLPVLQDGSRPIRFLIVTGYDHPAHDWQKTSAALRETLEKDPRFKVRIVEDPDFLESGVIHRYDALAIQFMNWQRPGPGEAARKNLRKFVEEGKGVFLIHFACGAFADWPGFRDLAGRVWDKRNNHDPRVPFTVKITDTKHPITKGMESFTADDELYIGLTGERPVDVLATGRSTITGRDHPMAFSFSYGKGRVFHTTLGHDAPAIREKGTAELMRRGAAWIARRKPVP